MVENADKQIVHKAERCKCCGKAIHQLGTHRYEKRQVFDLPEIRLETTGHRAEIKTRPYCHTENKADFPAQVSHPVQYGQAVKGLVLYLINYQLLPIERTRELFEDIFGHSLSGATLNNINQACADNLQSYEEQVSQALLNSKIVHFDDTGFYYEGKCKWLHSASTKELTYYFPHDKRGRCAMNDMGLLPNYKGIAVHDFWKSYLDYDCKHSLCNVHHLRDLTFCHEHEGSQWALKMKEFLQQIKSQEDKAKTEGLTQLKEKQLIKQINQPRFVGTKLRL